MSNRRVCFLTFRETLDSAFSSACVNPAAELAACGYAASILSLASIGEFLKPTLRRRWLRLRQEAEARIDGPVWRLPTRSKAWESCHWDRVLISTAATILPRGPRRGIIYARASRSAVLALALRRQFPLTRVIYRVRGPEAAEYAFAAAHRGDDPVEMGRRASQLDRLQAESMRGADLVICISQVMRTWVLQTYNIAPEKILVVPCFCDCAHGAAEAYHRDDIRAALGFTRDDFVVAYSGSMVAWQLSTRALRILHLLAAAGTNVRFLGLTMHASSLFRRLREIGFPEARTRVLTVPHQELARYLAAADLGILGRGLFEGRSLVNEVSSPIKFGEYLAVGTPVVLSEGVGDFSELADRTGAGVVLPSGCDDATALDLLKRYVIAYLTDTAGIRSRCQDVARQNLDLRSWVRELAAAYERVSTK